MKITVVGAGYVGLVTAAGFAELGHTVVAVEIDPQRLGRLTRGEMPIFEPGLEEMVRRNVAEERLSFAPALAPAVQAAAVVFVAVGTPQGPDGAADIRAVLAVTREVCALADHDLVMVVKSTVPVGTHEKCAALAAPKGRVHVVSNPEFLKEGDAVSDFLRPDRIVIGCRDGDDFARARMAELYHPLHLDRERILWMDPASAELVKYAANAALAMRISFMNEVARLCDKVGADIHAVRAGVGSDSRIGPKFLYAGPGYGGSCFPKDVLALVATGREHGLELALARTTDEVNRAQRDWLITKLEGLVGGSLAGRTIAVWGITFKPRTDDIRESAAVDLVVRLLDQGAKVQVHDPEGLPAAVERFGAAIQPFEHAYEAARGAEALVLMTEWREYQAPDFERLKGLMAAPRIFDARNIWSHYGLRDKGFRYASIGTRTQS
jgi:UDPglucose 6-dehydrogenase